MGLIGPQSLEQAPFSPLWSDTKFSQTWDLYYRVVSLLDHRGQLSKYLNQLIKSVFYDGPIGKRALKCPRWGKIIFFSIEMDSLSICESVQIKFVKFGSKPTRVEEIKHGLHTYFPKIVLIELGKNFKRIYIGNNSTKTVV